MTKNNVNVPRTYLNSIEAFTKKVKKQWGPILEVQLDRMKIVSRSTPIFGPYHFPSIRVKVVWTENWYGPNMVWTEIILFYEKIC